MFFVIRIYSHILDKKMRKKRRSYQKLVNEDSANTE